MPVNQLNKLRMTLVEDSFPETVGLLWYLRKCSKYSNSAIIVVVMVGGGGDDRAKLADNSTL